MTVNTFYLPAAKYSRCMESLQYPDQVQAAVHRLYQLTRSIFVGEKWQSEAAKDKHVYFYDASVKGNVVTIKGLERNAGRVFTFTLAPFEGHDENQQQDNRDPAH